MPTVYLQGSQVLYDDVDHTIGLSENCCCEQQAAACCMHDGSCQEITKDECKAQHGFYQGDNTHCDDPDRDCMGACCHQGSGCTDSIQDYCTPPDIFYPAGQHCDAVDCDDPNVVGVCCLESGGLCMTQGSCQDSNGVFHPDPSCSYECPACCGAHGRQCPGAPEPPWYTRYNTETVTYFSSYDFTSTFGGQTTSCNSGGTWVYTSPDICAGTPQECSGSWNYHSEVTHPGGSVDTTDCTADCDGCICTSCIAGDCNTYPSSNCHECGSGGQTGCSSDSSTSCSPEFLGQYYSTNCDNGSSTDSTEHQYGSPRYC